MGAAALARDEQRLCQVADTVVAVSEFAADDLATAYRIRRPAVIPNGVDRAVEQAALTTWQQQPISWLCPGDGLRWAPIRQRHRTPHR